jgi:hypothetical protein
VLWAGEITVLATLAAAPTFVVVAHAVNISIDVSTKPIAFSFFAFTAFFP